MGYTEDIETRLYEHNFWRTGYTSKKKPWILKHKEAFKTKKEALIREKYLKKLKSRIAL